MATDLEYAQLSARVYDATNQNRAAIPPGWQELLYLPDSLVGFSAGVYAKGNEIVISFTGTNETVPDFGLANFPAALGLYSPQVAAAMLIYEQVKRTNPNANISFTGHSLGGGLASIMAVYFNRPAVTFDEAPFEASAKNTVTMAEYADTLVSYGYVDATFDAYRTLSNLPFDFPILEQNLSKPGDCDCGELAVMRYCRISRCSFVV